MAKIQKFRSSTPEELRLLEALLPLRMPGRDLYLNEAKTGLVEMVDDDDSLFFKTPEMDAPASHSVISEAEYIDVDGVKAYLTVHVVHGRLHELEIYKEDGSRLRAPFQLDKIDLIWAKQDR